jgi:serine/threonine protein kinase
MQLFEYTQTTAYLAFMEFKNSPDPIIRQLLDISKIKYSVREGVIQAGGYGVVDKYVSITGQPFVIKWGVHGNSPVNEGEFFETLLKFIPEQEIKYVLLPIYNMIIPYDEINYSATVFPFYQTDLHRYFSETSMYTIRDIKIMLLSIAIALRAIHRIGYVHNDLKLENILYDRRNFVPIVLTDFGCVQRIGIEIPCATYGKTVPLDATQSLVKNDVYGYFQIVKQIYTRILFITREVSMVSMVLDKFLQYIRSYYMTNSINRDAFNIIINNDFFNELF